MAHHDLKLESQYFADAKSCNKMFEIRKNDRNYKVGDTIDLHKWNEMMKDYMGETLGREIIYITDFRQQPGYVVLGLDEI